MLQERQKNLLSPTILEVIIEHTMSLRETISFPSNVCQISQNELSPMPLGGDILDQGHRDHGFLICFLCIYLAINYYYVRKLKSVEFSCRSNHHSFQQNTQEEARKCGANLFEGVFQKKQSEKILSQNRMQSPKKTKQTKQNKSVCLTTLSFE